MLFTFDMFWGNICIQKGGECSYIFRLTKAIIATFNSTLSHISYECWVKYPRNGQDGVYNDLPSAARRPFGMDGAQQQEKCDEGPLHIRIR